MYFSISQVLAFGLLASAPLAAALQPDVEARFVGSPAGVASRWVKTSGSKEARHHTEAQIAAKEAAAGTSTSCNNKAKRQDADEFGPWDSEEDEFGSWVDKREPHHTEAQIAAKEAAADSTSTSCNNKAKRHHTEAQIAAKEAAADSTSTSCNNKAKRQDADEFGPWDSEEDEFGSWVDKREPHHTEAQIAAKEAAAGNSC